MTKLFSKESQQKCLGSALRLLPLLCAVCVVQPYPLGVAGCLLVLWVPMEMAGLRMAGVTIVLLQDLALRHGNVQGIVAAVLYLALAGELFILYAQRRNHEGIERFVRRMRPPGAFYPGAALGAAIIMTLYQTSGYFAVGAHGIGMFDLLRSYRNLGFHPNWNTVLFSTIMLVILITWPRKFKTLSKTLPAGFVGLVFVTLLNLLLNPNAARSTVVELPLEFLPFFRRVPISALSMLLIFIVWEEVPWKRIKACLREKQALNAPLLALIPMAMFCFDLLWVFASLALVWDAVCVARLLKERRLVCRQGAAG